MAGSPRDNPPLKAGINLSLAYRTASTSTQPSVLMSVIKLPTPPLAASSYAIAVDLLSLLSLLRVFLFFSFFFGTILSAKIHTQEDQLLHLHLLTLSTPAKRSYLSHSSASSSSLLGCSKHFSFSLHSSICVFPYHF